MYEVNLDHIVDMVTFQIIEKINFAKKIHGFLKKTSASFFHIHN